MDGRIDRKNPLLLFVKLSRSIGCEPLVKVVYPTDYADDVLLNTIKTSVFPFIQSQESS